MRNHKKHSQSPFSKYEELQLKIEVAKIISELSKTSLKVLVYIKENAFRDDNLILIDKQDLKSYCGFKQDKSVYNALSELINHGIIASSNDVWEYYYNYEFISEIKE